MVVLLLTSACSSSDDDDQPLTIRTTAEEMIAGPVADQAGLGPLTAACPDVAVAVGTAFDCTATTEDQRTVAIGGVINDQGRVELITRNVITSGALPSFERAAAQALNDTVGSRLADDAVDCGEQTVVFGQEQVMVCALLDPHTQKTFDITLTIADIEARQFSLVVADEPRP